MTTLSPKPVKSSSDKTTLNYQTSVMTTYENLGSGYESYFTNTDKVNCPVTKCQIK